MIRARADFPGHGNYRVTYGVVAVATAAFALLQSMTIPVLGEIEKDLDTTQAMVTWVLTAYFVSASVFTPIVGRVGDAVGKGRMLVFSLAVLAAGSLLAALADSIGVMIAARVIQGVGGGVLPLAFGIIRDELPPRKVAGAISLVSSLTAVGFGVGILVAGPIVSGLGYAWLFWLPLVVSTAAALAAWALVPESPVRTPGRVPIGPSVLFAGWLVGLLIAVSQAPSWGWGSPRVLGLLGLAFALVLAWIATEQRVAVPLIDIKMMRLPAIWTTNLVALLVGFGMYASNGFMPQMNQTPSSSGYGFGATMTESGLMMAPSAFATFLTGLMAAGLAQRFGAKFVVVVGCGISAGGMYATALAHDEKWQLYAANALIGAGIGLAFGCLASLVVAAVPPEQTGVASGMNANIRTVGGSIGSATMASIVTASTLPSGFPAEVGYTAGFVVLASAMLVAALCALMIPGVPKRALDARLNRLPATVGQQRRT